MPLAAFFDAFVWFIQGIIAIVIGLIFMEAYYQVKIRMEKKN